MALDTNIVVRLVINDDPAEVARATTLLNSTATFVGATVVLESLWVLTKRYSMTVEAAITAMRALAGAPGVVLEAHTAMHRAFAWSEAGMDVADAVHLALAEDQDAFATFDRDLVRHGVTHGLRVFEP